MLFLSLNCCVAPTISIPPLSDTILNILVEIIPAFKSSTLIFFAITSFINALEIVTLSVVRFKNCPFSPVTNLDNNVCRSIIVPEAVSNFIFPAVKSPI